MEGARTLGKWQALETNTKYGSEKEAAEAGEVSNWGLRRRCRKGGAGCRRAPRCEDADRAWAEVGWMDAERWASGTGKRRGGHGGARATVPGCADDPAETAP